MMNDKLANVLIVFIMIVILGLGGLYYVKVVGSQSYSSGNTMSYSEQIQGEMQNLDLNTNNVNNNSKDNNITSNTMISNTIIGGTKEPEKVSATQVGYGYNNRYYYKNLDRYSKVIYDAIANNIDNIKTGNYTINIDYDFGEILNNASGQDELKGCYEDAINAINLDIPDLFYINFSKMSLIIKRSSSIFATKYSLYINSGDSANYLADEFNSKDQVELAIRQIVNAKVQVKSKIYGSDYERIKNLHDWLIDYMSYDATSNQKATVYGGLIEKRGVCEAYARIYKTLLDEFGIENILVTGTATNSSGETEDHMWNYVKLNGEWYAVDVTWDDPIIIGNGTLTDEIKHRYFLNGSQEFFKTHTEKLTISQSNKIFAPPKLAANNY